ncbi:MAG: hypothetical protein KKE52_08075 [Alphaproteobacteria bacterium]|nr:hypothetical protein [Alphaproteobacteria bacterium]MBU2271244.1 hypothetical protein [Alphaproteobacteria bacterium]
MAYNPLFTRMVEEADHRLTGMVAYAIYKTAKKEWVQAYEQEHGRRPDAAKLAAYAATWTPQLIANANDAATSALSEFAAEAIDEARPSIVEEALRGDAVRSVLLSMLSALLYTVALVMVVVVLRAAGIDLISIIGAVR